MSVNVVILGFAHGHVNAYIDRWRNRPELGVTVVGGWDHDRDRLTKTAATLGIEPVDDAAALLAKSGADAAVIASETSLHADLIEQAAAAGMTIVVQKPMALTMDQADRIVAAIERHQVPFTMAWQMRVDPQNRKMKEIIENRTLGKVFTVRRRHGLSVHRWPGFEETWHNRAETNRDIWADDSSHPIDLIHWMLGVPETVTAEIATLNDPRVPNDNGIAVFRYPGGPIAEVVCSFTCLAAENTTEIVAENGTVLQSYGDGPSCGAPRPEGAIGLKWFDGGTGQWIDSGIPSPAGHGERIAALAEPLAEFLHGKRSPIATAEEGRISLRMTLATYVSSNEGRRVRLDDPRIQTV